MTNREAKIASAKCEVQRAETLVRDAGKALEHGYEKLKAEFDLAYSKLKADLARAGLDLEQDKIRLQRLEANVLDEEGDL